MPSKSTKLKASGSSSRCKANSIPKVKPLAAPRSAQSYSALALVSFRLCHQLHSKIASFPVLRSCLHSSYSTCRHGLHATTATTVTTIAGPKRDHPSLMPPTNRRARDDEAGEGVNGRGLRRACVSSPRYVFFNPPPIPPIDTDYAPRPSQLSRVQITITLAQCLQPR
jgi:hypothetical protein